MNFKPSDRILLVGEGNFSFSVSLLNSAAVKYSNVITSCFQTYRELPREVRKNCWKAYKSGAEVWFGIDATKLHLHEYLSQFRFDVILFNFPHVGGKMKIDRNRQLLRDFFVSCRNVISDKGKIYVTLCKGQGGTPLDEQRGFGNSWQIVSMAAYGDFVLSGLLPFDATLWAGYDCVGYRSLLKGFHMENAITHIFCKKPFLLVKISQDFELPELHCAFISSQSEKMEKVEVSDTAKALLTSLFSIEPKICNKSQVCLCKDYRENKAWKLENIFYNFSTERNCSENWYKSLLCQPCFPENGANPVKGIVFGFIPFDCKASNETLKTHCVPVEVTKTWNGQKVLIINYFLTDCPNKKLLTLFTRFHNKEVCCRGFIFYLDGYESLDHFPRNFTVPETEISLFPPVYTHDLSFWHQEDFTESSFFCLLRQASGTLARCAVLVDSYICSRTGRHSKCYRITYQDLENALSSQTVWHLHYNVIGKFLSEKFCVEIR